jgi:hypothetical protein
MVMDENIPAAPTVAVPCGCGGAPLDPEYHPATPDDHPLIWRVFDHQGQLVGDFQVAHEARWLADRHDYPAPVPVQL